MALIGTNALCRQEKAGEREERRKERPVAQRQEMVFGTLALLSGLFMVANVVSRALALKGDKVLYNAGGIFT